MDSWERREKPAANDLVLLAFAPPELVPARDAKVRHKRQELGRVVCHAQPGAEGRRRDHGEARAAHAAPPPPALPSLAQPRQTSPCSACRTVPSRAGAARCVATHSATRAHRTEPAKPRCCSLPAMQNLAPPNRKQPDLDSPDRDQPNRAWPRTAKEEVTPPRRVRDPARARRTRRQPRAAS